MSLGQQALAQAIAKQQSLSEDASRIVGRLSEIKVRLQNTHDHLFGSEPRSAEVATRGEAPAPNVTQYHVNTSHQIISEIESIITRIEAKL